MKYFVVFVIAYILGVISGNLYRDHTPLTNKKGMEGKMNDYSVWYFLGGTVFGGLLVIGVFVLNFLVKG